MGRDERFIGAWRLVSMESLSSDGTRRYPLGSEAAGLIQWDAAGVFSVQIAPAGAGASGDPAQYVAYFGTWWVDERTRELVLDVDTAFNDRLRDTQQRRKFNFEGNRLALEPPPSIADGATVTTRVLWERVRE